MSDRNERAAAIGATVRAARRRAGLSQGIVAELAGVSERFLRHLEHGKPTVQLDQTVAVLDVLGLELQVRPLTVSRDIGDER